jgi:hypothetical protein
MNRQNKPVEKEPAQVSETSSDRPEFIIAYAMVAASGFIMGLLAGWIIWARK